MKASKGYQIKYGSTATFSWGTGKKKHRKKNTEKTHKIA